MKKRVFVFFLLPLLTLVLVAAIAFVQPWASHRASNAHAASTGNYVLTVTSCPTEATLTYDFGILPPGGTILFNISSPCTISLSQTFVVSQNLTLSNQGQQVTLDGGGALEDLQVNAHVKLALNALTIVNGNAQDGGGLQALTTSTVNVSNSTFANNVGQLGGGLFAQSGSKVSISNSTFANNSAQLGGGLFGQNKNTLNISNTTFTANTAQFGAGLLANQGSKVSISNSTFSNDSAQLGGVLDIDTANSANISNTTFTNDSAQFAAGLLINATKKVSVNNTTFANDSAQFGTGFVVDSQSTVSINNSTFSSNAAQFGAGLFVHNGSTVNLSNSTFGNNSAQFGAGLLADSGVTVNISNSTFGNNSASDSATSSSSSVKKSTGKLNQVQGQQQVLTFNASNLGNVQPGSGGALFANQQSTVNISNSTFAYNSATANGGGLFNNGGSLRIAQSIVADNTGGDCAPAGPIFDMGYNLSSDASCGFTAAKHSLVNTNPLLDPAGLANNGGPTQTIALLTGSPAIDKIPAAVCLVRTDQRGFRRPDKHEPACDIGAYESQQ